MIGKAVISPRSVLSGLREHGRQDALASVVVFLVALPLCMGIAIASGVPPAAGLITGIVGGLLVGMLAGAPLQVSGPAAGLSVIVWELVQTHGMGPLGWIVLIAGAVQVAAGLVGCGRWFRAVSPAVIQGMLAGIGVLIFASQFHVMVDDAPRGSGLSNLFAIPEAIYKSFVPADGSAHFQAAMIGLLTLTIMFVWRPLAPGLLKIIPAPLVAVTVATLVTIATGLSINRVDIPASMIEAITLPRWADLTTLGWSALASGIALAFVASAETLLCATAVDKLHTGPRANFDRELTAQGVGNLLCGALGGLPMTGVIVRSSANIEAGGRTRASTIMHGAWLLLFCAALPFVLNEIPTAVLAAVLVFTGYKLVNIVAMREIARFGRIELAIYGVTLVGIVCIDLLTGVVVGIGISLARLLYHMSHLDIEIKVDEMADRATRNMWLRGSATVICLPHLAAELESIPNDSELHVHLDELAYIDHACIDLLINWDKQHTALGGQLFIDWEGLQARFSRGSSVLNSTSRAAAA